MTDGSRALTPVVTAGLDLGDKYSYLCFIDEHSGEVMEEGRLRTTPEAFARRFDSEQQMMVAIEAGTHLPWVSRKLEECGPKVLVANPRKTRLIYGQGRKTTSQSGYRELPTKPGTYVGQQVSRLASAVYCSVRLLVQGYCCPTTAKPSIIPLGPFIFLQDLQEKQRADERTRTADLLNTSELFLLDDSLLHST
jgi:hypothetical protein